MSLIDYKGFRLIAVSLLPLSKGSLVYGSNDAGETIHRDVPELNRNIDSAAKKLNLKPHRCGKKGIMMGACVDLEGFILNNFFIFILFFFIIYLFLFLFYIYFYFIFYFLFFIFYFLFYFLFLFLFF